jgi:murein DD-endopeptidase MepM/ murein hydrolase activator NlpD
MLSLRRHSFRLLCAVLLAAVAGGATTSLLTRSPAARAASESRLQQQISAGQSRISSLSGAVGASSSRVANLKASISSLQVRISRLQGDLNRKRAQLLKLRSELNVARTRLVKLEAFEARAESLLSQQVVRDYETDRPDIVSVVLEARGFQDLLERIAFAQRIRKENASVVARVRSARRAVAAEATRLGVLSARQQRLTVEVLTQRNTLARVKVGVVQQELAAAHDRRSKAGQLADVRARVAGLQHQLDTLQATEAAAAGSSVSGSGGGSASASTGPGQVSSGGGFTFPLPKGTAAPPGAWSLDQGVDIAAPGNTPELAVCSGTIVLHGIGGFGPWAPVLHCDSPLSGGSYVYYGHAGPANQLAIGTHVSAGQVMSSIGPGIVGISSGPHVEIGFCDSSGTPIGGGTASQMMSLLRSSYGG